MDGFWKLRRSLFVIFILSLSASYAGEPNLAADDPYEVLGLTRSEAISPKAIVDAYRRAILKFHPEFNRDIAASQQFEKIKSAYAAIRIERPFEGQLPQPMDFRKLNFSIKAGRLVDNRVEPRELIPVVIDTPRSKPVHPPQRVHLEGVTQDVHSDDSEALRVEGAKYVLTTAALTVTGVTASNFIGAHFFGLPPSYIVSGSLAFVLGMGLSTALGGAKELDQPIDWNGRIRFERFGATGFQAGLNLGLKTSVIAGACDLAISALAHLHVLHKISQMGGH